jgi:hypothetical protein
LKIENLIPSTEYPERSSDNASCSNAGKACLAVDRQAKGSFIQRFILTSEKLGKLQKTKNACILELIIPQKKKNRNSAFK